MKHSTIFSSEGELPADMEPSQIADNYIAAIKKGILKTMSKMGISTLRSYTGAQLFEAIGLNRSLVDEYFTGTSSRIGGIGLAEIAQEAIVRHNAAFQQRPSGRLNWILAVNIISDTMAKNIFGTRRRYRGCSMQSNTKTNRLMTIMPKQ